jgi:hypothetical protein
MLPFRCGNFPVHCLPSGYSKPSQFHNATKLNSGDFSEEVLDDRGGYRGRSVLWMFHKAEREHCV